MSKVVKTYLYNINSGEYYLKSQRSRGFMEPNTRYQLLDKLDVPEAVVIKPVKGLFNLNFEILYNLEENNILSDSDMDILGSD